MEARFDGAQDDVELKQPIGKSDSPTLGHTRNLNCRHELDGVKRDFEPKQPIGKTIPTRIPSQALFRFAPKAFGSPVR